MAGIRLDEEDGRVKGWVMKDRTEWGLQEA